MWLQQITGWSTPSRAGTATRLGLADLRLVTSDRQGSSDRFFHGKNFQIFCRIKKVLPIFGEFWGLYILRLAGSVSFSSSACSAWNSKMFQHPNDNSWLNPTKPASPWESLSHSSMSSKGIWRFRTVLTHIETSVWRKRKESIKLRGFFRRLNSI